VLVAVGSAPRPSRRPTLWSCRATFYANLLIIERRKCLLVIHAATLFSVFCPDVRAAQLRQFGPFLVPRIIAQLEAEGLSERALGELDGDQVIIAATTGVAACWVPAATLAVAHPDRPGVEPHGSDGRGRRRRRGAGLAAAWLPAAATMTSGWLAAV